MQPEVKEILDKLQYAKDSLKVISEYFWLKIDRYNENEMRRGETFNEQFEKRTSGVCSIIDSYCRFIEKSFAQKSPTEIAKMEAGYEGH